jgi:hypothetical protein
VFSPLDRFFSLGLIYSVNSTKSYPFIRCRIVVPNILSKKLRQRIFKSKSRRAILTRFLLKKSTTLSTYLKSKKLVASKKQSNRTIFQRFDIEVHSHFVSSFKDVANKKNEKTFYSWTSAKSKSSRSID